MRIEVDQSGKVENTQTDTVLAFSDGKRYSIVIPARLKRKWFALSGEKKKSKKESYLLLFSAGLFLLLKNHIERSAEVIIDREYLGQDANLRAMLLRQLRRAGVKIEKDQIQFTQIGKESKAHKLALSIFRERDKANRVIGEKELFKFAR